MTRVLLVGSMATGKTTIGLALGARTGWPCIDNDVLLERSTGRAARDLLAVDGEPALRRAESDVLTLVLGMPAPLVAGVAAGVVLDPVDRERLRTGGHVVWLRASLDTLVHRVGQTTDRPWLGADPRATLARLAAERSPLYEQVASQTVDVDGKAPGEVAREVLEAIEVATGH